MVEENSATYEGNFEVNDQSINMVYDNDEQNFFVEVKSPKLEIEFPSREELLDFIIECASLELIHKKLSLKIKDVDFDKGFGKSLEEKIESMKKEKLKSP